MDYLSKERAKKAQENFHQGYNCAQSVFLAFADLTNLDKDFAAQLVCGMGAGVSRLREISGAVSSMALIAGMLYGYSDPKATDKKNELYKRVQTLAYKFKAETGSYVCKDLLGVNGPEEPVSQPRTAEYYQNRPCERLVGIAAGILQEYIEENPYTIQGLTR